MKKVSLLVLFAFAFGSLSFGQVGTVSATYTVEDIPVDDDFGYPNDFSICPGLLNVPVPNGATIIST